MNISFDVVVKLMSLLLLIIFIGMHANNKDIGSVQQDTLEWCDFLITCAKVKALGKRSSFFQQE